MSEKAEKFKQNGFNVIADFVCPTPKARELFNPDFIVWMDTIEKGRFEDTNKIFVKPEKYDVRVTEKNSDVWSIIISDKITKYEWDNKKPTAQMLGRWQPLKEDIKLYLKKY